jgi:alkylhydroperoxidase/carboxymuconolactone decarboxylase family protein YurZ
MRLGLDEVGVTELMGVSEHTRALATAALALCLDSLDAERALVPPLDPGAAQEPTRSILEDIAVWAQSAMGRRAAPVLWRVLGHNPHYIESTWRKERALMADGMLSAHDKRRTALGVAMAIGGRYMIEYCTAILKHGGDTDRDVLEILGVVDHYTTLNTLSEGMQIESDIRPPG